jgi:hypothetical protein
MILLMDQVSSVAFLFRSPRYWRSARTLSANFFRYPDTRPMVHHLEGPFFHPRQRRMLRTSRVAFTAWLIWICSRRTTEPVKPAFKPRKVNKEEKYRDRAAERRTGEPNDYAQVCFGSCVLISLPVTPFISRLKLCSKILKDVQRVMRTNQP